MPSPDTLADPTAVPPDVHELGGVVWGPNTVKVIVPVAADPPVSAAAIEDAGIGLPAVAFAGALADTVGLAGTTVSAIAGPQAEAAGLSDVSPP